MKTFGHLSLAHLQRTSLIMFIIWNRICNAYQHILSTQEVVKLHNNNGWSGGSYASQNYHTYNKAVVHPKHPIHPSPQFIAIRPDPHNPSGIKRKDTYGPTTSPTFGMNFKGYAAVRDSNQLPGDKRRSGRDGGGGDGWSSGDDGPGLGETFADIISGKLNAITTTITGFKSAVKGVKRGTAKKLANKIEGVGDFIHSLTKGTSNILKNKGRTVRHKGWSPASSGGWSSGGGGWSSGGGGNDNNNKGDSGGWSSSGGSENKWRGEDDSKGGKNINKWKGGKGRGRDETKNGGKGKDWSSTKDNHNSDDDDDDEDENEENILAKLVELLQDNTDSNSGGWGAGDRDAGAVSWKSKDRGRWGAGKQRPIGGGWNGNIGGGGGGRWHNQPGGQKGWGGNNNNNPWNQYGGQQPNNNYQGQYYFNNNNPNQMGLYGHHGHGGWNNNNQNTNGWNNNNQNMNSNGWNTNNNQNGWNQNQNVQNHQSGGWNNNNVNHPVNPPPNHGGAWNSGGSNQTQKPSGSNGWNSNTPQG